MGSDVVLGVRVVPPPRGSGTTANERSARLWREIIIETAVRLYFRFYGGDDRAHQHAAESVGGAPGVHGQPVVDGDTVRRVFWVCDLFLLAGVAGTRRGGKNWVVRADHGAGKYRDVAVCADPAFSVE